MNQREDKVLLTNQNIQLINEYFNILSEYQIDNLFDNLEDILFFYGFRESEVRDILQRGDINNEIKLELPEFFEITNSILFYLKYKMDLHNKDAAGTNS